MENKNTNPFLEMKREDYLQMLRDYGIYFEEVDCCGEIIFMDDIIYNEPTLISPSLPVGLDTMKYAYNTAYSFAA